MARKTYTVKLISTYEVVARDEVDAQFSACALAAGCQDSRDRLGESYHIGRADVKAVSSDVVSTEERKTAEQIITEFGTKTEEKKD